MRSLILFTFFLTLSAPAFAQDKNRHSSPLMAVSSSDVISHQNFDALLKKFVDKKGQVNYKALAKDRAALDTYLKEIGNAKISGSDDAKLAFYINTYNAIVIDSVLQSKLKGVMETKGFFKKNNHKVAGTMMTLDHLENSIIRKDFAEPRIHFVLVCGAKSCPRLRQEAATQDNVIAMMEAATKEFIPLSTKVKGNKVKTSELFNWFKDDFIKAEGSVGAYLAKYLPEHAELLKSKKANISFSKYSWKLNKQ